MEKIAITGVYKETHYRDEASGFTRFAFTTKECREYKNSRGFLICTGIIPVVAAGIPLKLVGKLERARQGWVFKVEDATPYSDRRDLTVQFLCSDAFKGIGERTAEKIVGVTGSDLFSFIERADAAEVLATVVNHKQVSALLGTLKSLLRIKDVTELLTPFGGTYADAIRVVSVRSNNPVEALKKDCYSVGVDADIPFSLCDSLAHHFGYYLYDERRIRALLITAFTRITGRGHTCTDIDALHKEVNRIVKSSAYIAQVPRGLLVRTLHKDEMFVVDPSNDKNYYYFNDLYKAEVNLAKNAHRLQVSRRNLVFYDEIVTDIEDAMGIEYSEQQKKAFSFIKDTGIKILTGGPGTGKSTVINGIITAYKLMNDNKDILLCAPTGRAAQKMTEITGLKAQTIHKALDVKPFGNSIEYKTLENPLEYDLIIVDEVSMADIPLVSILLGAVKTSSIVILCGDINQLPSVGPGSALKDLIASKMFDTVTLDVIYRQAKGSSIIGNANCVNAGETNLVLDDAFKIIEVDTEEEMQKKIIDLIKAKYDTSDPFKLQVLSSTKKGLAGTKELNIKLQEICNPKSAFANSIQYGSYKYSVGDKIIMISNNYKKEYYNGDIGIVTDVTSDTMEVKLQESTIILEKGDFRDVLPAIAITVHKFQGSEAPTVIVSLPSSPSIMLQRNLFYTAITRSRKEMIIVAQRGAIETAIKTISNSKRDCRLLERLKATEVRIP